MSGAWLTDYHGKLTGWYGDKMSFWNPLDKIHILPTAAGKHKCKKCKRDFDQYCMKKQGRFTALYCCPYCKTVLKTKELGRSAYVGR